MYSGVHADTIFTMRSGAKTLFSTASDKMTNSDSTFKHLLSVEVFR